MPTRSSRAMGSMDFRGSPARYGGHGVGAENVAFVFGNDTDINARVVFDRREYSGTGFVAVGVGAPGNAQRFVFIFADI